MLDGPGVAARPEEPLNAFAHLSLEELRAYRKTISEEEGQVSYWRRILQARLDLLRDGRAVTVDTAALRPVLTDARVGRGRQALLEIVPVDDIPPLPHLAELWDRGLSLDDPDRRAQLEQDLADAERQLSEYRAALHRRIEHATAELIARYRAQPTLCLSVLPLRPERRVTA